MYIPQNEYNKILAQMPIVCVDIAIVYHSKILLIRRNEQPAKGEWWLPGGRLFKNESLESCAFRKAGVETGMLGKVGKMIHYQSTVFDTVHSVNFCYMFHADNSNVRLDNTASEFKWIDNISELYHPYIKECLSKALWEIRTKLVMI